MADEVKESLDVEPEMMPGSGGIFEVVMNGKLIFSKKEVCRFPERGEIASLIQGKG